MERILEGALYDLASTTTSCFMIKLVPKGAKSRAAGWSGYFLKSVSRQAGAEIFIKKRSVRRQAAASGNKAKKFVVLEGYDFSSMIS